MKTPLPSDIDQKLDHGVITYYGEPKMTVFDARNGHVLRTFRTCQTYHEPVFSDATHRIFEFCEDGRMLVIDSATYRQLASIAAPAVGTGAYRTILVDAATRRVFQPGAIGIGVYDATTGALVRTLPILAWWLGTQDIMPGTKDVVEAPFVDPGAQTPPREVLVLDGTTGAVLHHWPVPDNPLEVVVNPLTGHVLVSSAGPWEQDGTPLDYGTLSVLDARTGAILKSIKTGVLPAALAADRATGHLFVVNFNSNNNGQPIYRSYPDGGWPQFQRRLKDWASWLPFSAPALPPPPSNATVMMLDLASL